MEMKFSNKYIGITLIVAAFLLLGPSSIAQFQNQKIDKGPLGYLVYEPTSHDFGNIFKGDTDSTIFYIWMGGGCCSLTYNLDWDASWIDVFPTSGTSAGEHDPITVTIDTSDLEIGYYTEFININSNGGNGVFTVYVNVIETPDATLMYEPQSHDFGNRFQDKQYETTFNIWNSGSEPLNYTLTWDEPWMTVTPTSGTSNGEQDPITINIDLTGLTFGYYTEDINIQTNNNSGVFKVDVNVVPLPDLRIGTFKSGVLKLKTELWNPGDVDAPNVQCTIRLTGGTILFGQETIETISLVPGGGSVTMNSAPIIGFGKISIYAEAKIDDDIIVKRDQQATLLFAFILVSPGGG